MELNSFGTKHKFLLHFPVVSFSLLLAPSFPLFFSTYFFFAAALFYIYVSYIVFIAQRFIGQSLPSMSTANSWVSKLFCQFSRFIAFKISPFFFYSTRYAVRELNIFTLIIQAKRKYCDSVAAVGDSGGGGGSGGGCCCCCCLHAMHLSKTLLECIESFMLFDPWTEILNQILRLPNSNKLRQIYSWMYVDSYLQKIEHK